MGFRACHLMTCDCDRLIRANGFEVVDFVQGCSGWHMLARPACVAQPSEICRATSHDIGGI